jgi:hypothetical protein
VSFAVGIDVDRGLLLLLYRCGSGTMTFVV